MKDEKNEGNKSKDISLGKYMGERVATLRSNCGLQRKEVALLLGVTEPSVYLFETTGNVRGETLRKYLNILYNKSKVNPAYVLLENIEDVPQFLHADVKNLQLISELSFNLSDIRKELEQENLNTIELKEKITLFEKRNSMLETRLQSIKSLLIDSN